MPVTPGLADGTARAVAFIRKFLIDKPLVPARQYRLIHGAKPALRVRKPMPRSESQRRPSRVAKGLYANHFEVAHTAFEFVVEFGDTYANARRACHTRIVMTPVYATALLDVLERAVRRYESRFGPAGERRNVR